LSIRRSGKVSDAVDANSDGRSAQYDGNSVSDCDASINGGAVMLDRSPLTVARKEIKSFKEDKLPNLPMKSVNNIILDLDGGYRDCLCSGKPTTVVGKRYL
jgi:hypothetical protein